MLVMDQNLEQPMSNEANVQIPKEKQAMEESQISATCVTLPLPGKEVSEIILTLLLPGGGIFAPPITYLRIRVCVCVYAC